MSVISLPAIKAIWFSLTKFPRTPLILLVITLLMHLYNTLQQAIGLKSETLLGVGILGTNEIKVAFNSLSIFQM